MSARQYELTLLQERSAGTFARVYLAEASGQDGIGRIVAVKVLKEQWSESSELLDRTRDEARLLARLHHRNILREQHGKARPPATGQQPFLMREQFKHNGGGRKRKAARQHGGNPWAEAKGQRQQAQYRKGDCHLQPAQAQHQPAHRLQAFKGKFKPDQEK
jgi:hypothetical protein